jgi:hypothetical protein
MAPFDLNQYPDIPLSEYTDEGNFWFINRDFPGLRAIHKDPWIFLVPQSLIERAMRSSDDEMRI